MSFLIQIIFFALPWRVRRVALSAFWGFKIHRDARIGFSLIKVKSLYLAKGASIGHFTIIKGLDDLFLDEFSFIGNINWITGFSGDRVDRFVRVGRVSSLSLGEHSAITNRHYIDCTSSVVVGRFSTIAGVRSQIFTHSINLKKSIQDSADIIIGDYCFIGTGVVILPGSGLASYTVVGASAVISKKYTQGAIRILGNPAVISVINVDDYKYFSRSIGYIN